jgi:hypothetical protein
MVIATSLSPNHICNNNQAQAIQSWQKFGKCYSLNHPSEIINSGITALKTLKTVQSILGKPLVNINAFFDFALKNDRDLLLINSDIVLTDLPKFKQDGITAINRYDYTNTFEDSQFFQAGFDAFYIPKQFLTIFPPSVYALGSPWHDYWIPKRAMEQNIPLYLAHGFAYHKVHNTQYNDAEWFRMGEYFKWEFQLQGTVPEIASRTIGEIRSKLINI